MQPWDSARVTCPETVCVNSDAVYRSGPWQGSMALASWTLEGSAMEVPAGEKPKGDNAEALCQQKQGQLPSPRSKEAKRKRSYQNPKGSCLERVSQQGLRFSVGLQS